MSGPECPNGCDNDRELGDGRTGSDVIGHAVPGLYDGVAYWSCPRCGAAWQRFDPPGRITDWVAANVTGLVPTT